MCGPPGGHCGLWARSPGLAVGRSALAQDRELVTCQVPELVLALRDTGLGQAAQSLTCSPSLGRHRVGPSCPRRWGAFPPRGEHGTEGPAQTTAGERAEPGVRAASPPGLPSLSPTCTPRAGGPACWVGPPPPAAEVGRKPATPVPSALRLVPSQAVGPSGAATVASLGALDLQTPPLCSAGMGHPRSQTHGPPPPTASCLPASTVSPALGVLGSLGWGSPCRNARGSSPGYQGPTHGLCWAPSVQAPQCPLRPLDSVIVSTGRSHSRMVGSASFMAAGEGFGRRRPRASCGASSQ